MRARSTNQEDYLLRLIKEAAAVLRLLRHRLAGTAGAPESVREQASMAISMLLGARAPLLARLDAASAVHLVGQQEHVALWVGLLEVEAEAAQRSHDPTAATALHARARALGAAMAQQWGEQKG